MPGYLDLVFEALQKASGREDVQQAGLTAQYVALYLPKPDSFDISLAITVELEKTGRRSNPMLYVRKASALGQKYSYSQLRTPSDVAASEVVRKEALAAVEQVVDLTPDADSPPGKLLKQLFDPGREKSRATENDLEIFRIEEERTKSTEFSDLIYRE
ncbi:hypothetical protein [Mesorhizobium sp. AR02]|uniref:hypothetical protein n=1 Tax=Mesorhizobium sp. AR02 TaxID=2865837 RepID=UPI00215E6597|nr:hypothetical protein [Mesorhizobium sp. AR02]